MLPVALIYTPSFAVHDPGQIIVKGNNLYHLVAGQELLDPDYTLDKIQFPYPIVSPVLHPEASTRLSAALAALTEFELDKRMTVVEPEPATVAELQLAHTPEHIAKVQAGLVIQADFCLSPRILALALTKQPYFRQVRESALLKASWLGVSPVH